MYAITAIPGVGRRFANVVCKKAAVDAHKRAGELTADEVEKLVAIIQNPKQFKIPTWFLNRQKDYKTGKYPGLREHAPHDAAVGPGAAQEDPGPPGPAPLLVHPRARPAHEVHGAPRQDDGGDQEVGSGGLKKNLSIK